MKPREITANGVTRTLAEWAEYLGITPRGLKARLSRMPPEEAVTMPRQGKGRLGGRLSDAAVRWVRERYAAGDPTAEIARDVGASEDYVRELARGKSRRGVAGPISGPRPGRPKPPEGLEDRNAAIVAEYMAGATQEEVGRRHGVSGAWVGKIVRAAVDAGEVDLADRKPRPRRKRAPTRTPARFAKRHLARNRAIVAAYEQGDVTQAELGRRYGLTRQRISEIIRAARSKRP